MADILIKGMDMPKSCFYCPFREKANPDDYVCMALNKEFEEHFSLIAGKRHKDCPLVEVSPSADVEPVVRCKDCIFGHKCFNVVNGRLSSWVECINPDGLYRDISCDGYCSVGIKHMSETNGDDNA